MELKQYLQIVRKWLWLIILSTILGAGAAFGFSSYQEPVYKSSAKAMLSQPSWDQLSDLGFYYPFQLIQTYSQLITTTPFLDEVSERVGAHVNTGMVSTEQIGETNIIAVSVEYYDPQIAADIANMLIEVLIRQNEALETNRFSESEISLQKQIEVVQTQITSLEDEITSTSEESVQSQLTTVEEQIAQLQTEIVGLQLNISELQASLPAPSQYAWIPTPTVDIVIQTEIHQYQLELEQRQGLLNKFQDIYFNLLTFDSSELSLTNPNRTGNTQYQNTLALYQQIYSSLLSEYERARLSRLEKAINIVSVEPAIPSPNPVRPQPITNSLLGAIVGFMLAGGVIFLIEYLDDTVKSPEDIQRFTDAPVIGYLPAYRSSSINGDSKTKVFVLEYPRSPVAESFRSLRTNIEFAEIPYPTKIIMVTSPEPQEGKSTTAANLAAMLSQGGKKVFLVDADLRRPTLHKTYNFPNRMGLTEYFRGEVDITGTFNYVDDDKQLIAITSGKLPPNPTELLASEKMCQFLGQLKKEQAYVIIDTPPLMVTDPVVLISKVDGVLLVIEPGKTKLSSLQTSIEQLERAKARIIGIALNNLSKKSRYYFANYYHTDYYYGDEEVIEEEEKEAAV